MFRVGFVIVLAFFAFSQSIRSCPLPSDAVFPFDGKTLQGWVRRDGTPPKWNVRDGYVEVVPGTGDIQTEFLFGDADIHVEFWVPYRPDKHGQERGNSGVYIQSLYEVQILDSWENPTYFAGGAGALYRQIEPKQNASLPPEKWQTFDIHFRAPRTEASGQVTEKGSITVIFNGIPVIEEGRFDRPTGAEGKKKPSSPGPLRLQDHGSRVRFRNIWIRPG